LKNFSSKELRYLVFLPLGILGVERVAKKGFTLVTPCFRMGGQGEKNKNGLACAEPMAHDVWYFMAAKQPLSPVPGGRERWPNCPGDYSLSGTTLANQRITLSPWPETAFQWPVFEATL